MNVLVVDDEAEAANYFSIFLQRLGLNVEKATCAQEALELFNRYKPEWVFLDMKMPDMNGLDLLRQMKQIDAGIKTIMISAQEDSLIQKQIQELGISDYLIKPINLEEMARIIKKHIPEQEQSCL